MKRFYGITVLLIILAGGFAGCDEFWQKGDVVIQDVNAVAGGARALLESPAGVMIPPEWKLYGAIAVALANGVVIAWQGAKNNTMKKTTQAIVKGIELTDNPQKATSEVKANIADEMRRQGGDKFYARANKIVDKLKIS